MSIQTFAFDSRLPVSDTMDINDPTHPRNITRSIAIIQNQASADTRYDALPPKRVVDNREEFANPTSSSMSSSRLLFGLIVAFSFAIFYFLREKYYPATRYVSILFGIGLIMYVIAILYGLL